MKTAIYLRKSRADEQNAENTLEKHKETLLEFAAKNNLTVTKIYEEVVSGESIFNRPEMLKSIVSYASYERKKGEWNNDFFLDIHFKLHK